MKIDWKYWLFLIAFAALSMYFNYRIGTISSDLSKQITEHINNEITETQWMLSEQILCILEPDSADEQYCKDVK